VSGRIVAVELRNRSWVAPRRLGSSLAWYEEVGAIWVGVDAPPREHWTIMPPVDAVTRPGLAYLRAHGRTTEGCVRGKAVAEHFAWRYSDAELEEIGGRARAPAERAEEVRLMLNDNRGSDASVAATRARQLLGQEPRGTGARPDAPQRTLG